MRFFLFSSVLTASMLTAGCQRPASTSLSAEELEAVKAVGRAYQDAINAEDVDGIVAVFAQDGISLPPGWEPLRGHDEIRRFWEGQVTGVIGAGSSTTMAIYGEGGLAYDAGTYIYTYTDTTGVTRTRYGKFLGVYKKQADGSWKLAADMWNLTPQQTSPPSDQQAPP